MSSKLVVKDIPNIIQLEVPVVLFRSVSRTHLNSLPKASDSSPIIYAFKFIAGHYYQSKQRYNEISPIHAGNGSHLSNGATLPSG